MGFVVKEFVIHFLWTLKPNILLVKVRLMGFLVQFCTFFGIHNPKWLEKSAGTVLSVCKGEEYFNEVHDILPCNDHTWTPWDVCTGQIHRGDI